MSAPAASDPPVTAPAPAASPSPPPPSSPPPPAPPSPPPPARRPGRWLRRLALLLFALIALAAAFGWWWMQTDLDRLRAQLGEAQRQLAAAAEQTVQRERDAQLRLERLEGELTRLRDQRTELDQFYRDATRGRDDLTLLEVERLVIIAAQELQLSGSVSTALAALQTADARLARIDRPQVVGLRRAITRDIERLRAAPQVDPTGLALKIDQLIQGVDGWVLLAEALPAPAAVKGKAATKAPVAAAASTPATGSTAAPAPAAEAGAWSRVRAWLQQEFGELVQVRTVDTPEALLLDGAQRQLVRQQVRLRLLDARTALLTRNDRLYRADLAEVQVLLARYFDPRHNATAAAQAQLKTLAAAPLSIDLPQIADSLDALRGLRQGPR